MRKIQVGYLKTGKKEKKEINGVLDNSKISEGIEARPLFGSIPTQQKAYQYLKEKYKNKLINADYLGLNGFYIGCHQYLSQEDLDYITKTFGGVL